MFRRVAFLAFVLALTTPSPGASQPFPNGWPSIGHFQIGPATCDSCPPIPICDGDSIPVAISGTLPNTCWEFRGLELYPSPLMTPLPEPSVVRLNFAYRPCDGQPCQAASETWQAAAMLPPLPARDFRKYRLFLELYGSHECDSGVVADSLDRSYPSFTVVQCDSNGKQIVLDVATLLSTGFELSPIVPNPLRSEARFTMTLEHAGAVDLAIYDVGGRQIATLHRGWLAAGMHSFHWNGGRDGGGMTNAGVYLLRAKDARVTIVRKLVVVSGH